MNSGLAKIFVYGASGHAKVVIDVIEQQGLYEVAFLADDNPALKDTELYGYRVIGGKPELLASGISKGVVAIGSNRARAVVSEWLVANGFDLLTAVHPRASVGRGVTIGEGTVVMAGAVINSDTTIGRNAIINTRASIDHDCTIGDNVHIAPGSVLCGTVTVGECSFVCAGTTIIPNLNIGKFVIVGAGSTVIRDVPDSMTVAGTPARELLKEEKQS